LFRINPQAFTNFIDYFRIDPQASADFKAKFDVSGKSDGKYYLVTKKVFDREAQKTYSIPIEIEDNQVQLYWTFLYCSL
jgi:hypothetical protein